MRPTSTFFIIQLSNSRSRAVFPHKKSNVFGEWEVCQPGQGRDAVKIGMFGNFVPVDPESADEAVFKHNRRFPFGLENADWYMIPSLTVK